MLVPNKKKKIKSVNLHEILFVVKKEKKRKLVLFNSQVIVIWFGQSNPDPMYGIVLN